MQESSPWLWYSCAQKYAGGARSFQSYVTACFYRLFSTARHGVSDFQTKSHSQQLTVSLPSKNFTKLIYSAVFLIASSTILISTDAEAGRGGGKKGGGGRRGGGGFEDDWKTTQSLSFSVTTQLREVEATLSKYSDGMNDHLAYMAQFFPDLHALVSEPEEGERESESDRLERLKMLLSWLQEEKIETDAQSLGFAEGESPIDSAAQIVPATILGAGVKQIPLAAAPQRQGNTPQQVKNGQQPHQNRGVVAAPQPQRPVVPQVGAKNVAQSNGRNGQQQQYAAQTKQGGQQGQRLPGPVTHPGNKNPPQPPPPIVVETMLEPRVRPNGISGVAHPDLVAVNTTYNPNIPSTAIPGAVWSQPYPGVQAKKVMTTPALHELVFLALVNIFDLRKTEGVAFRTGGEIRSELIRFIDLVEAVYGKRAGKLPDGQLIENVRQYEFLTHPFAQTRSRASAQWDWMMKERSHRKEDLPIALSERTVNVKNSPLFASGDIQTKAAAHQVQKDLATQELVNKLQNVGSGDSAMISASLLRAIVDAVSNTVAGGLAAIPKRGHVLAKLLRMSYQFRKYVSELNQAHEANNEGKVYASPELQTADALDTIAFKASDAFDLLRSETTLMETLVQLRAILNGELEEVQPEMIDRWLETFNENLVEIIETKLIAGLNQYSYPSPLHASNDTQVKELINSIINIELVSMDASRWKDLVFDILVAPSNAGNFDILKLMTKRFRPLTINALQHMLTMMEGIDPELVHLAGILCNGGHEETPEEQVETLSKDPAFAPGAFDGTAPATAEGLPQKFSSFDSNIPIKQRILEKIGPNNTLEQIKERSLSSGFIHVVNLDLAKSSAGKINQVTLGVTEVHDGEVRVVVHRTIKETVLRLINISERDQSLIAQILTNLFRNPDTVGGANEGAIKRNISAVNDLVVSDSVLSPLPFLEATVALGAGPANISYGDGKNLRQGITVPRVYPMAAGSKVMIMDFVSGAKSIDHIIKDDQPLAEAITKLLTVSVYQNLFFASSGSLAFAKYEHNNPDFLPDPNLLLAANDFEPIQGIHPNVARIVKFAKSKGIVLDPRNLRVLSTIIQNPMDLEINLGDILPGQNQPIIRTLGDLCRVAIYSGIVSGNGAIHGDLHRHNWLIVGDQIYLIDASLNKLPKELAAELITLTYGLQNNMISVVNQSIKNLVKYQCNRWGMTPRRIRLEVNRAYLATEEKLLADEKNNHKTSASELLNYIFLFHNAALPKELLEIRPSLGAISGVIDSVGSKNSLNGSAALWGSITETLNKHHAPAARKLVLGGGISRKVAIGTSVVMNTCGNAFNATLKMIGRK